MNRTRFTQKGFDDLKKELADLQAERPGVIADVQKARELGDLKENGYYQASKAKLRSIDASIMRIQYYLKTGIVSEEAAADVIGIGSTVTFHNGVKEVTYQFVGDLEADPSANKLSLLSPIGRALEGKKKGDVVSVQLPGGVKEFTILKVSV